MPASDHNLTRQPDKSNTVAHTPDGEVAAFPEREDERWQPMKTAPQDGSPVWLWIVHPLARFERDPIEAGYEAPVEAHWIDHNGGGWTWHGLAGQWTKWMPRDQAEGK